MTATVAIQSLPVKTENSVDNSVRSASGENRNDTAKLGNDENSSFKDLYDDAKKVENAAKTETRKADTNEPDSHSGLDEDGKSLPPEDNRRQVMRKKDLSEKDNHQSLFVEQAKDIGAAVDNENTMFGTLNQTEQSKHSLPAINTQLVEEADKKAVSVLTGLNQSNVSQLNGETNAAPSKLSVSELSQSQILGQIPEKISTRDMTGGVQSLAQRLSLTKAGEGLAKNNGLSEKLSLSPAQLTDDLIMSDMDKALNKITAGDKLSLDAMLGKLETVTHSNGGAIKPNAAPPLSTAFNASPTLMTQDGAVMNQTTITESLGKPEWNQSMSKQIAWMASHNIRSAEIKLTPANLGTIEVRVEMNEDKLNVAFSSRDAGVRDSVEQAMPKLREMMEQEGLALGDTDVSEQTFMEQQEEHFSNQDKLRAQENSEQEGLDNPGGAQERIMQTMSASLSAVDYYI